MGRRHGPEGAFTFDLVPDDGAEAADSAAGAPHADLRAPSPERSSAGPDGAALADRGDAPAPQPAPFEAVRGRWRQVPRRTRLAALVVAAALAGTVVVVDGALDRGRTEELRTAAGGVVDLSSPPVETWRIEDRAEGDVMLAVGLVGVTGDVAAVKRRDELVGVDLLTGRERWAVDLLDARASCGPGLTFWNGVAEVTPTTQVVCVGTASSGEQVATVVEPDGTVLARRTVDEDLDLAVPGPDGSLLTASWVGDPQDVDVSLRGDPLTDLEVLGEIDDGYDLEVRLVDALTGAQRWTRRLPFGEVVDETRCVRWTTGGRNAELDRAGAVDHVVAGRLLGVAGCGILAYLTPEGDVLDLGALEGSEEEVVRRVQPLVDGGFAVSAGLWGRTSWEYQVLDAQGVFRFTVAGRLLDPWATDGRPSDRLLVAVDGRTVALDAAGEEVWRSDVEAEELLARAGQVAVVLDDQDRLVGLDLETGDLLWVRDGVVDVTGTGREEARSGELRSVFTDGTVVALAVPRYDDTQVVSQWRAVDAATGEELWSADLPEEGWGVDLAVDGHLLRWWPRGLTGFTTSS
ncbi:outer membrane protein assembly factor BamB family protein [Isoptericola aurantiacus]|uniref:outer membrane protein assembly factor BamB family protein n=1 Tax=Isoptericola aurantiacus TaxID=3377839 RepID=UPI00383A96CB